MMMGPTKKKVIATGVVAFIIPVIVSGVVFWKYSEKKRCNRCWKKLSKIMSRPNKDYYGYKRKEQNLWNIQRFPALMLQRSVAF